MTNWSQVVIPTSAMELPMCALQCLSHTIPAVGCSLLDHECQCASRQLSLTTSKCVRETCTLLESYQLIKYDAISCNRPHTSKATACQVIALAAGIITFTAVILRVISRLTTVKKFWWDDYFHIAAGIFAIPLNIYAGLLAVHGIGRHTWDIDFDHAQDLLYWFYHTIWTWSLIMWLLKMSILSLYLRIFTNNKHFRWVIWGSFIYMGLGYGIILPMAWATCVPVSAIWDVSIKNARCLNVAQGTYGNAAVNISTEFILLFLPIPMLKELQLPLRKKIPLFFLFTSGIFVIIVACLRLPSIRYMQYNYDQSFEYAPNYIWSCAEMAVVQAVTAAPATRTLFARGKAFLTQKSSNGEAGNYYSRSRTNDRGGFVTSRSKTGTSHGNRGSQHHAPNSILHTTSITMNFEKNPDTPSTTVLELNQMQNCPDSKPGFNASSDSKDSGPRDSCGFISHIRGSKSLKTTTTRNNNDDDNDNNDNNNNNGDVEDDVSCEEAKITKLPHHLEAGSDVKARSSDRGSQDSILDHDNFAVESGDITDEWRGV